MCDTVSELAAGILEGGDWPELLPFMFQCVQSGQPRMVEAALLVFAQLARYLADTLRQYLGTLHTVRTLRRGMCRMSRPVLWLLTVAVTTSANMCCSTCKLASVCCLANSRSLICCGYAGTSIMLGVAELGCHACSNARHQRIHSGMLRPWDRCASFLLCLL